MANPSKHLQNTESWQTAAPRYARAELRPALIDLATSVVPFLALWAAMYQLLDVSYLLVLALSIPAGGFLVRTFIVFHDCTHGSFLPSRRWNTWTGRITGLMVFAPFRAWQHDHAVHHATAGDLDRRGQGDVPTLTVAEYRALPWIQRTGYRLFRNPAIMFTIGPVFAMIIKPRMISRDARPRLRHSVYLTNAALVAALTLLGLWLGFGKFWLVEGPAALIAGISGVWLFYVQHQFEDVYWESSGDWSYADAALRGSSYLRLPKVLQYFSGNIGLHHVHHLSAHVPNYKLQAAHDENEVFQSVPVLTLTDGLKATRLKLYDEEAGRMVTWREVRVWARQPAPDPA